MALPGQSSRSALRFLSVGMVLVACVVLGYLGGRQLDAKLGTDPWLAVGGLLLGSAAGFLQLFHAVARDLK